MTTIRTLMVAVGLSLALTVSAAAQTTVNSTTLAAAVTSTTSTQFQLASTSNVSVGDYYAIVAGGVVRESGVVRAVSSPYVTVGRATNPIESIRAARLFASGTTVYTGAKARFYNNEVNGSCTSTAEAYLPHISTSTGFIYNCNVGGVWYRLDQTFTVPCFTGVLITASADQSCWTANGNYLVVGITYVSQVVESGGTLTIIPRKQTTTQAPASGAALATAISGVSTVAQTVTSFTLTSTAADVLVASGNRLGLDFTDDVAGELLGVLVTFTLAPR